MNGRKWLKAFMESLEGSGNEYKQYEKTWGEWTKYMVEKIMGKTAKKLGRKYYPVMRLTDKRKWKDSGELLNMDTIFILDGDENWLKNGNYESIPSSLPLPSVVVEHENSNAPDDKILYCLWKIICIRADVRILICYSKSVDSLKKRLENEISKNNLMKNADGDLLVIIGDEKIETDDWDKYFTAYEWRNDNLREVPW